MDTSTNPYLVTNVGAGLTGYAMSDLADISLPTGLVPTQVACLGVSTCVLGTISSINKVYCFGKNTEGQLGILASGNIGDGAGEMGTNLGHVDLGGAAYSVDSLSVGCMHACVLIGTKTTCWGYGGTGRLGRGNTNNIGLQATDVIYGGSEFIAWGSDLLLLAGCTLLQYLLCLC